MILPCTLPPDTINANMKSAGSGRGVMAELNGWANSGPLQPFWLVELHAVRYGQSSKKE